MDLEAFRALLKPTGQAALHAAGQLEPREADFLRHFAALSKSFPPDLARAALEIAILRREAAAKFPQASQMYFTRPALEQASSQAVASYRAGRFQGFAGLADLGCSIGGDTLALAQQAYTLGCDLDLLRLEMARENLAALGLKERGSFLQADLTRPLPFAPQEGWGLFFDPARRAAGRRLFSVRQYLPALEVVFNWLPRFPAVGVKISPGVALEELAGYPAEIEFISLNGELKEAVLWFGPLKSASRRATLLPGAHSLAEESQPDLPLSTPLAFVYEPDPAVLRAGQVAALGARLNAAQLDPDIAYLTSAALAGTPFAHAWPVEAWFPFNLKMLRAELRARQVGRVTVKKRGSPLEPEQLIRELRLPPEAPEERTIFLTHLRGRPIVILAGKRIER